ncbi:hypothetical protein [Lentzea tibetensis]|nr:hypothetical protein [Lentzea tibetensis]
MKSVLTGLALGAAVVTLAAGWQGDAQDVGDAREHIASAQH